MQGRSLVPKSVFFYLFFFLTALGGWLGTLALYCNEDYLAHLVSKESLPFLDLNQTGSISQWFMSFLWLLISVHSFMVILLVMARSRREAFDRLIMEVQGKLVNPFPRYNAAGRIFFWLVICVVSFLMSANTICQFFPVLQESLTEMSRSGSGAGGEKVSLLIVGGLIGGLIIGFLLVQTFWRYILSVRKSRFILYPSFFLTFVILVLAISCRCCIPEPDTVAAAAAETKTEIEKESQDLGLESEKEKELSYQNVAYSKPADSKKEESEKEKNEEDGKGDVEAEPLTWESIFGLDQTLETKLGMDKTMEESFNLDKASEAYLFDRLPELSVVQVRCILRRGFYGLFLVFFSTSLGLLARSERILLDKRAAQQALQLFQGYDETFHKRKNRRRYGSGYYDD